MLHKVTTNYKELARLVPGLLGRLSSSARKKQQLLEMARKGEPRPTQKKHPLGTALSFYTNKSSNTYDPKFTVIIKKIAPNWFVSKADISNSKKRTILEMAERGCAKPIRGTELGTAFQEYTYLKSTCYDPVFTKRIKKVAPDWLLSRSQKTAQNKNIFLKMAESKKPGPKRRSRLGALLSSYMAKSSATYDPVFSKKIRRLAPHWFFDRPGAAKQKKKRLIAIAKNGNPKPHHKTELGRSLSLYTRKSGCYDLAFTRRIKKLAPHWFVSTAKKNKQRLLELAKKNCPRPSSNTKLCLVNYTWKKSATYDPVFDEQIRRLAPEWFVFRSEIANKKKQEFLEMARKKHPKPTSKILKNLVRYTYKKSSCYDPAFDEQIRRLAPKWFLSKSEITKENKWRLLDMARNELPRPSRKTKLNGVLASYMTKSSSSYDPVFAKKIRKLAPHWFRKCSTK
jgi:hypothetical protein